jgi:hypothetical protein
LANAGADVLTLKRHGSWKSSTVAENYVAESMCNKIKIAKMIQCGDGIETNSNTLVTKKTKHLLYLFPTKILVWKLKATTKK